MIEAGIVTHLLADTAVAALVATRVSPGAEPQGVAFDVMEPCITWERTGTESYAELDSPASLAKASFVFACWAETATVAKTLGDAVAAALNLGAVTTVGGVACFGLILDGYDDSPSEIITASERRLWATTVDITVWYRR